MIELKNIYKRYVNNTEDTVVDFNLEIEDGEFIVFVGPSGCGKSTTLRMVAGLEEITSGEFIIDGKKMNNELPKDRDIAMVFQNYALYPHMTVSKNMGFSLNLQGKRKEEIEKKVLEVANILEIKEHLGKKPSDLSGGQRQRVALERAMVRDPKLFLMDEPLSNLDAKLRVQTRAQIQEIHNRLKTTTIYVTHDQTEAMTMADRIVIMKDGIIQQVGKPKDLYNNPKNMFVGGFLGSPHMNFLNGELEGNKFVFSDSSLVIPEGILKKITENPDFNPKDLIYGIRPEYIKTEPIYAEINKENILKAKIKMVELLGSQYILFLEIAGNEIQAVVEVRQDYEIGDEIDVVFDMNKAQFFDAKSENSLLI